MSIEARFQAGDRVEVLRTDGSSSMGTVELSYEGVHGRLFQVLMDNGVHKRALSEDELVLAADPDDVVDEQARTLPMWQCAQMDLGSY